MRNFQGAFKGDDKGDVCVTQTWAFSTTDAWRPWKAARASSNAELLPFASQAGTVLEVSSDTAAFPSVVPDVLDAPDEATGKSRSGFLESGDLT